jgi:hypothetical protein
VVIDEQDTCHGLIVRSNARRALRSHRVVINTVRATADR